ncbi:MAG: helix-turn-helix domain-containing protein [Polyangia bacterium]
MRKHPIVDAMADMLEGDPSLTGKELSARLGLSVSRLARVFKAQRGMSIVEYRHRLRFARFFALVTKQVNRPQTLMEAARIAGFGSYPHFHRLFCARWHKRPREMVRDATTLATLGK